jgi:hypothetical protein
MFICQFLEGYLEKYMEYFQIWPFKVVISVNSFASVIESGKSFNGEGGSYLCFIKTTQHMYEYHCLFTSILLSKHFQTGWFKQ